LSLGALRGVREVAHSGSTAGYRAFLARYPDERFSVAVLCNAREAPAADLAREVAGLFLGDALQAVPAPVALTPGQRDALAGLFRDERSGEPLRLVAAGAGLRIQDEDVLLPLSGSEFRVGSGQGRIVFDGPDLLRWLSPEGEVQEYRRVAQATPTAAELLEYEGEYASDEAEVTYTLAAREGGLTLKMRPATQQPLRPAYRDAFTGPGGLVLFRRDDSGRIEGFSLGMGRVRDLRFRRLSPAPAADAPRPPSSGK
jgi:hypothetical protein